MTALVVRADARHLPLPDQSVDLIVTSPPYFALRSYQDGGEHYDGQIGAEASPRAFLEALWECTTEWLRVLKPAGSLWVNLGDKYVGNSNGSYAHRNASRDRVHAIARTTRGHGIAPKSLMGMPWRYALGCIDDLGMILRAEVIWSKPNGLPESVTDRVRRSHEQWFHFTQHPRYYAAVDEIREPYAPASRASYGRGGAARAVTGKHPSSVNGSQRGDIPAAWTGNPLGKLPGSVWTIPSEPLSAPARLDVEHFAAFPTEWPRRIIRGWSPHAGTVLDPFGGTGTTALVADVLGRTGISVDLSHDYCRLAQWRTTDPNERARAMRVDKPPTQVDGQGDLLVAAAEEAS